MNWTEWEGGVLAWVSPLGGPRGCDKDNIGKKREGRLSVAEEWGAKPWGEDLNSVRGLVRSRGLVPHPKPTEPWGTLAAPGR